MKRAFGNDLAKLIAQETHISQRKARLVVETIREFLMEALEHQSVLEILPLGQFIKYADRNGHVVVRFIASPYMKKCLRQT